MKLTAGFFGGSGNGLAPGGGSAAGTGLLAMRSAPGRLLAQGLPPAPTFQQNPSVKGKRVGTAGIG